MQSRQEWKTVPEAPRALLVGREAEVQHLVALLESPSNRLVTVVGAGGVGKSAIAEEACRRLSGVERVPIRRIGLQGRTGSVGLRALVAMLSSSPGGDLPVPASPPPGHRRLALLDGLEAAPAAGEAVARALDDDPGLVLLVTSVSPLRIGGEHLVQLDSLPLPPPGVRTPDRAVTSPAVRLFCDLATAADPRFELTDATAADVVDLCIELDGLPLALELAAARCTTMSVATILELYRSAGLAVLAAERPDAPTHHRSLRNTIGWSFELVEPRPQHLLAQLSVFTGSFDRAALRAVVGQGPATDSAPAHDVALLEDMSRLISPGLVRRLTPAHRGGERYVLPVPVRQFALELAARAGDRPGLRRRHADHYRAEAAHVAAAQHAFGGEELAQILEDDQQDLIEALNTTAEEGDPLVALAFATDLEVMWMGTGAAATGARYIDQLLGQARSDTRRVEPAAAVLEARSLVAMVTLDMWSRNRFLAGSALQLLAQAVGLAGRAERPDIVLRALCAQVQLHLMEGDAEVARQVADKALAVPLADADDYWRMTFLSWRAVAANTGDDAASALDDAVAARDLAQKSGDERELLLATHVLSGMPGVEVDPRAALPSVEDMLAQARALGDLRTESFVLHRAAWRSALSGDLAGGAGYLLDTLELARRTDTWYVEEFSLILLTMAALQNGHPEEGARLHGSLSSVLPAMLARFPTRFGDAYMALVAGGRAELGDGAFDQLVAGGRLLSWTRALAMAERFAAQLAGKEESSSDPELARYATGRAPEVAEPGPASGSELSPREAAVLRLIASGCTNKEVATALGIRPRTVMNQTSSIYRKLGVRGRTEAVMAAWKRDLLDRAPESP